MPPGRAIRCARSYESLTDWSGPPSLRTVIDKDGGASLRELPPIQRFLNRVLALPIHMQNALFASSCAGIADQTERARAGRHTSDLGVETPCRGEKIEQVSTEDLWTCPRNPARVTRSYRARGDGPGPCPGR